MLKNYFLITLRNLRRYSAFSIINIAGLSIGIACCIIMFLYVQDEIGYDSFNKNADRIYRVHCEFRIKDRNLNLATSPMPLGPALKRIYPEVANYTRIRSEDNPNVRYGNKIFSEKKFYWVDSSFFEIFSTTFIYGNPKIALTKPYTIVITESVAKKYFGNSNPVGKTLGTTEAGPRYLITGVVKSFPHNSHFHFDFLASLSSFNAAGNWVENNCYTYILLNKGADPDKFPKKLRNVAENYLWAEINRINNLGLSFEQFEAAGNKAVYRLQPLTSIHLYSHLDYELEPNSDISYVYIFSSIALAVLILAMINFMNLATARSGRRTKEVGIRKALGAGKKVLIGQFIVESIVTTAIAIFIAVCMVEIFMPMFNEVTGRETTLHSFNSIYSIPVLICFAVFVGILAGSYPAFYLSSFSPAVVLKKGKPGENRTLLLRDFLVVFQFAVSVILIIGTFVIHGQLSFIQNKNLGFNKEQVVVINTSDIVGSRRIQSLEQELMKSPGVINVTASSALPGMGTNGLGNDTFLLPGKSIAKGSEQCWILYSDYNMADTYQMKIVRGRYFDRKHGLDVSAAVINETAAKEFGKKDIIGKDIVMFAVNPKDNKTLKVIGIVKDFNFESLHQPVHPLVILLFPDVLFAAYVSVRVAPGNISKTIGYLKTAWVNVAGSRVFNYKFLDKSLANLYRSEQITSKIAAIFSLLAIFIACLGLFGLAAFMLEQKTKEIGIRKILGASVSEIVLLLSKEFTKWVLIANLIAWPVAYYVMHNWLKDFAYRINISWWIFVLSGGIALLIALATVSFHAIKAATANPIDALRYE